jgi:hypothetical protein
MADRTKPSRWRRGGQAYVSGREEGPGPGDGAPAENPYVGPRPFEALERDLFFGRGRETRKLASLIVARRVVLLYAQSGAGKTSLLQAGLGPHLEEGKGFRVLPPGRVGGDLPPGIDGSRVGNVYVFNTLLNMLGAKAHPQALQSLSLSQGLKTHFGVASGAEGPVILVLDQLEELFTSHPTRYQERAAFFRQLDACLDEYAYLSLLLALREDYLAPLDDYAGLMPDRLRARLHMERLGYDAALSAVVEPARWAGRSFEEGVAEALVANLAGLPAAAGERVDVEAPGVTVEPVHLQIVCHQLWERVPAGLTAIRARDVEEFGDVDEALKGLYEEALEKVVAKALASEGRLRAWFALPLITPAGTRGLVYRDEERGETGGLPNDAVDLLYNAYLIRPVKRGRDTWYELAHDRLVAPILESNRAWELAQARLRPPEIAAFEVDPLLVSDGAEVTFTWQVAGADQVVLQPVGQEVPPGGSLSVTPGRTAEYWLEARKEKGRVVESQRREVVVHDLRVERWYALAHNILNGIVVPVISSSFVYDTIFGDAGVPVRAWAEKHGLASDAAADVAQVAGFLGMQQGRGYARHSYDDILKSTLLQRREDETGTAPPEVRAAGRGLTFSELVRKVGIPGREPEDAGDPFRILARLPLPLYVTTSYHELMEDALKWEGKNPRTETFSWSRGTDALSFWAERKVMDYEPTENEPLVYHLYGLDAEPESWVLSEEDYLDFLSEVRGRSREELPVQVLRQLSCSSLLFLGFDLQAWEFRALWHGVLRQARDDSWRWRMIHLFQTTARGRSRTATDYIRDYLYSNRVEVYWGEPEEFLRQLWEAYEQARE